MDLAQERGASSWLTILPLEEFGLTLHKGAFRDAIALRYGCQPALISSTCACGTRFSVEHALSYPMGGFPIVLLNDRVRNNFLVLVGQLVRAYPKLTGHFSELGDQILIL